MEQKTIAFVGAGNMTRSIISGMIKNGYPADKVTASNPSIEKLNNLQRDFSINITQDNKQAVSGADVVVLAVKPQLMEMVCKDLHETCDLQNKLFVSIAAGISSTRLQEMLGGRKPLIRTMPNTPSALGRGMTGLYADEMVSASQREFAGSLMQGVGEIVWVENESEIDGVIAAAGSSPAYFFLFLQAMQDESIRQGFDKDTARLMVQQAMLGAAEMVCDNPNLELSELRSQVTSKGGTTAKAIEHFQQQGLEKIVSGAMQAAIARAKEMSEQF